MKRPTLHWPAIAPPRPDEPPRSLWTRLLWMVGIWAASVAALFAVAMLLRFVLRQ